MTLINVMPPMKISERKEELLRDEKTYQLAIHQQFSTIKNQTRKWGKVGLITSASLVSAYFVFNLLAGKNNNKKKKAIDNKKNNYSLPVLASNEKTSSPWIIQSIKAMMLSVLVAVIKVKIEEALEYLKEEKEQNQQSK